MEFLKLRLAWFWKLKARLGSAQLSLSKSSARLSSPKNKLGPNTNNYVHLQYNFRLQEFDFQKQQLLLFGIIQSESSTKKVCKMSKYVILFTTKKILCLFKVRHFLHKNWLKFQMSCKFLASCPHFKVTFDIFSVRFIF